MDANPQLRIADLTPKACATAESCATRVPPVRKTGEQEV